MRKTIYALALVGAIMASSTSVAYADTTSYTKYSYLQKIQSDNFELNQLNDDLEDELKEYKTALRLKETIEEMSLEDFDDNYDDSASRLKASQTKLYDHIKEGKEYLDKYVEQQQKENDIVLTGEKNYYNYLIEQKNLQNKVDNFTLMKSKYDAKLLENQLGKISDLDLLSFEKTYNDSFVAQLLALNAAEKAKNSFNQYISVDINEAIDLTDIDIPLPEYTIENLDATLQLMLDNSYQLKTLEMELQRLEADRILKGRYSGYADTKIELENNAIAIDETNEQIKDIKLDLAYQLLTKYNDTMAAENTFKSAELSQKIQENQYKVAQIKYDNQMISSIEYIEAKQNYDNAINNYFTAKLNAYAQIQTFNDFIDLNTVPVNMDFN